MYIFMPFLLGNEPIKPNLFVSLHSHNNNQQLKLMKQRLLSLDVLRGLTVAGMILVNTPGSWQYVWTPLEHSEWNGLTPTDLVFPSFMFMMGMAMFISLRKFEFKLSIPLFKKIIRRTLVIFLIGTCINIFANCMYGLSYGDGNFWQTISEALGKTRTLGVLQRLALCYGIGSFIVVTVKHKRIPIIIISLLLGYFILQMLGNGFAYGPENILSVVDRTIIGIHHMYNDNNIDPEGILSTIPSVAHVLVGFYFGKICMETKDMNLRLNKIFVCGSLILFAGLLLQYSCPINKKVWSPTFVLTTCGIVALLLAILLWFIDTKGKKCGARIWTVFGVNPLFCYVLSNFLTIITDTLPMGNHNIHSMVYGLLAKSFGDNSFSSCLYAILMVAATWLIGDILYRKKIYIKI